MPIFGSKPANFLARALDFQPATLFLVCWSLVSIKTSCIIAYPVEKMGKKDATQDIMPPPPPSEKLVAVRLCNCN